MMPSLNTRDEKFVYFSQGHGSKTSPQAVGAATTATSSTPETVADQFGDEDMEPTEGVTAAATAMPPQEMQNPLREQLHPVLTSTTLLVTITLDPTALRLKMTIARLNLVMAVKKLLPPLKSQPEPQAETVEDNPPTPDICPGTPDVVIAQLEVEQQEAEKQSDQPKLEATFKPVDAKDEGPMVDPLQVLPASVPTLLGSTTITEEEDLLLSVGDVTTTETVVRPPPTETGDTPGDYDPDEKDDVQLTSADVGHNIRDI